MKERVLRTTKEVSILAFSANVSPLNYPEVEWKGFVPYFYTEEGELPCPPEKLKLEEFKLTEMAAKGALSGAGKLALERGVTEQTIRDIILKALLFPVQEKPFEEQLQVNVMEALSKLSSST